MAGVKRELRVGDTTLCYELERKSVKRINLRVRRDGSVYVSAPPRVALATVEGFLRERLAWIEGARARQGERSDRRYEIALTQGERLWIGGEEHVLCIERGASTKSLRQNGRVLLYAARPTDQDCVARAFTAFVKAEAARMLGARLAELAGRFAPTLTAPPLLEINFNKSRWGVCYPTRGKVALNARLIFLPPALADYVILHELCHFRVPNHSPEFHHAMAEFYFDEAAVRRRFARARVPFWRGRE